MSGFPEVDLSVGGLRAAAEAETGLKAWGGEAFVEPLTLYLEAIEESAGLHNQGRYVLWKVFMRLLCNRLLMARDFAQHPEIEETAIPRPLYILGMPRTGTTLLHNLLACDPAARSIRLWEGFFPSPPPDAATRDADPRIAQATEMVGTFNHLAPKLAAVHYLDPTGPEECLWLFEHTFVDFIHELRAHVPRYSDWLTEHEADPATYREYRKMVQLLGWRSPGQHWVFKAPRHLMGLAGLLEVFPEARIVQTHRDPLEVLPSLCSLCEIDRQIFTEQPDKDLIGDFWMGRLQRGFTHALEVRESDTPERYVDVAYRDLIADPIAVVKRIYEAHGYAYTDAFEQAMRDWLEANRQHKHGVHRYALEDYGLEAAGVNRAFAPYRERFGLG
jgi:hypothetical protein